MIPFWKKKDRCFVCGTKLLEEEQHELRLNTADGLTEHRLCGTCAAIVDYLAEKILEQNDPDEPV